MIPLFNDNDANGKRNVLEGRFIWLALRALGHGIDVVLDFGVWSKDERTALRALAASVGALCSSSISRLTPTNSEDGVTVVHLEDPDASFDITDEDLDEYRRRFSPPDDVELSTGELDPPPLGYTSWNSWASEWWPTSIH